MKAELFTAHNVIAINVILSIAKHIRQKIERIDTENVSIILNGLVLNTGPANHITSRPSTSLQRLIRLDRVDCRDRFSMKKPLCSSTRGASFNTKHALNVNAIETY
jgi:hypothetical protein